MSRKDESFWIQHRQLVHQQHPSRQHGYPAGRHLNVNDLTYGAIFATLQLVLTPMQGVAHKPGKHLSVDAYRL